MNTINELIDLSIKRDYSVMSSVYQRNGEVFLLQSTKVDQKRYFNNGDQVIDIRNKNILQNLGTVVNVTKDIQGKIFSLTIDWGNEYYTEYNFMDALKNLIGKKE
jgi:hypothetical protein